MNLSKWLDKIYNLHPREIDLDLSRLLPLAKQLNLTQFDVPVVMVAGTNGKGSVIRLLESIYTEAGLRVAAYTSPHLFRFNERLNYQLKPVEDELWVKAFEYIEQERNTSLSFFEFTTLAALSICQQLSPELILLEVGLGGRLDAVNIVEADIAVITNVDLDHMDRLGDTREKIGFEKAGILRPNQKAVCGDPNPPASVLERAKALNIELHFSKENLEWQSEKFKPQNIATATKVTELLNFPLSEQQIATGIQKAQLAGRYQVFNKPCKIILDVAHNPQAAQYLADRLVKEQIKGVRHAVVGMLADKDIESTLSALSPLITHWHIGSLSVPRGADSTTLATKLGNINQKNCYNFDSVGTAMEQALERALPEDLIVVFGSFYTVADALEVMGAQTE